MFENVIGSNKHYIRSLNLQLYTRLLQNEEPREQTCSGGEVMTLAGTH